MRKSSGGFTIVELLIVIVVIAILAAISIVAYGGIQQRARDSQRVSDLNTINKYIQLYIIDKGGSPASSSGCYRMVSTLSNCESMSIFDGWSQLMSGTVPRDPINNATYNYRYIKGYRSDGSGGYVGAGATNDYVIATRLESSSNPTFLIDGVTYNYAFSNR